MPGMAFGLHNDQRARANGALDVMEAARPAADEAVLDAIEGHVFRRVTSPRMPNGGVPDHPALARLARGGVVAGAGDGGGTAGEHVAAMLGSRGGLSRLPRT